MKITKILASGATPAKAILNRAQHVALTSFERDNLPAQIIVNGVAVETEVSEKRPLEIGDVLLDDGGHFYVVDAAPESVLMIKGDEEFAAEAAVALLNRGIRVAQIENGFAIAKDEALQQLLTDAGLEFEEVMMPFEPIKLPKRHHGGGCCCGGHHHHDHSEGCGCHGGHHHHDEEGCCCGGEHHHHHHHEDGECCCGHHDHEQACECGDEHHHGDGCCCGHHDHDEEHHHHSHQRHYHHEEKNKAE